MTTLMTEVAIIGAGTAGCFIANLLEESGIDCYLIEKSRGLGGRCSRRRIDNYGVDLGAPDFSINGIENKVLLNKIDSWLKAGYLLPWYKRTSGFNKLEKSETIKTLCAAPSMNTLHKKLSANIKSLTNNKVHSLQKVSDNWQLLDEHRNIIIEAKQVIVTCPAEQAFDLLHNFDGFAACEAMAVKSLPQYVCAIKILEPLELDSDTYLDGHPIIKSAINESRKPSRVSANLPENTWLIHSTTQWAHEQSSIDSQLAAEKLTDAFCQHFDIKAGAQIITSHFWRLARHKINAIPTQNYIWNETLKLGCCGDWLDRGDIAGALNSSFALSHKIITS